jgi:hypothetical protein
MKNQTIRRNILSATGKGRTCGELVRATNLECGDSSPLSKALTSQRTPKCAPNQKSSWMFSLSVLKP